MKLRWFWATMLVTLAMVLGAVREFLFLNLNYQIDHVLRHTPFSYAHSVFQMWVQGMDLSALRMLKWAAALFFITVTCLLTVLLTHVLFGAWRQARSIIAAFVGFALFALLCHGLAHWSGPMERVSVQTLHMLQYPVPLLFVCAAALLPAQQRK